MRAIEKAMIESVNGKKNFCRDNTSVKYCEVTKTSAVFLHGNHIGTYMHLYSGFRVDIETLRRWPTRTTKSRLRALGCNVYTKNGITYYNGVEV